MAEKKKKISCYLIALLLLFTNIAPMFFLQKNAYASSAYYNDNIYESSSTYASIDESSNNIIKEIDDITTNETMRTKTVQDGKTKKIYNTIIVKTKKNKKKAEKVQQKATEKDEEKEDKEIEKKIDKYIEEEEVEEEKQEKKQKLSKLDTLRYYIDSTRVKRPDPWYLYAAFGYTLGLPKSLEASAVWDNTETQDERYNSISASGTSRINGWGFTAGIKKYVNRNVFAFYIALETFYNRLSLNDLSFQYNTKQQALFYNTSEPIPVAPGWAVYQTNIKIPATINIAPKSVFGGSMRIGLTLINLVSIFGKINIGGMNYMITSSINFNDFSMSDVVSGAGTKNAQIKERLVKDWEYMYKNASETFKSMAFTYGFGGGVELTLWNQHLLIRVDYDQYFTSNTISVNKLFARATNGTIQGDADALDTQDKITSKDYGNKWKIKNSFGILKLVVGVSF